MNYEYIESGDHSVYLQYAVMANRQCIAASFYHRSLQTLKGFSASVQLSNGFMRFSNQNENKKECMIGEFESFFSSVSEDKEKCFHGIMLSKEIGKKYLITDRANEGTDLYHFLMNEYDLPLLEWWGIHILKYGIDKGYMIPYEGDSSLIGSVEMDSEVLGVKLKDLIIYDLERFTLIELKESIKTLFAQKIIYISPNEQKPIKVANMDEYFDRYGSTLVEHLNESITPVTELNGNIEILTLKTKRLYPQQAAMVNGVINRLKRTNYCILNEGMGVGKTLQSISIAEGYFVSKYLNADAKRSLKDVYEDVNAISYRNIIMCPGHMVEKWAEEIRNEIPYSQVTILTEFHQLLEMLKKGSKRTAKEYYIMSKDFAKLSYMEIPTPQKIVYGKALKVKVCKRCGAPIYGKGTTCQACKNDGCYVVSDTESGEDIKITAMMCPECNEPLIKNRNYSGNIAFDDVLLPEDFSGKTNENSYCYWCGASLWQPFVKNIDRINLLRPKVRKNTWIRATHYANKTKKAVKSVWVHRKYARRYFDMIEEEPLSMKTELEGTRKYSPALFIKRKLKGYFDFAIFDEAHLYKGGSTGQGNAMDDLIKASKKQLALTGTIAGGMADHLFYLMYRLDPEKMRRLGFGWNDVRKFAETYGVVERRYAVDEESNDSYRVMCRGRSISQPMTKTGISPTIFMDLLLDCAVFLDLSDMSRYLPELKEKVVTVPFLTGDEKQQNIFSSYQQALRQLKASIRQKNGKKLLGKLLQFSLSYLDKPFGEESIINPGTGNLVMQIDQHNIWDQDYLLPKEEELIRIVRTELEEGRKCFVFAEYTASPETCVTNRLKDILEKHLKIRVAILESASPEPMKREAWIHEQAEKMNVDVVITNPKIVETGLDFVWKRDGVEYNYPTIIFYQLGYSLFTVWQASRRHYRLNQTKECRTYYMGYEGTIQATVIELIAAKQVATSAIQGKFSVEGLAAMAKGVDTRVIMAEALSSMDFTSGQELQNMFDVLNTKEDDDQYADYKPMLLLHELISAEKLKAIEKEMSTDIEDLLEWLDDVEDEPVLNDVSPQTMEELAERQNRNNVNIMQQKSLYQLFGLMA